MVKGPEKVSPLWTGSIGEKRHHETMMTLGGLIEADPKIVQITRNAEDDEEDMVVLAVCQYFLRNCSLPDQTHEELVEAENRMVPIARVRRAEWNKYLGHGDQLSITQLTKWLCQQHPGFKVIEVLARVEHTDPRRRDRLGLKKMIEEFVTSVESNS